MKPSPTGWPRISSGVYYRDAAGMIDWLCQAYGFEVRLKVVDDGGRIEHSELTLDEGVIMVGQEARGEKRRFETDFLSPLSAGGNTQVLMVYVDDVDAHCARARETGARIIDEPKLHDYGPEYWADRAMARSTPRATSGGSRSACEARSP